MWSSFLDWQIFAIVYHKRKYYYYYHCHFIDEEIDKIDILLANDREEIKSRLPGSGGSYLFPPWCLICCITLYVYFSKFCMHKICMSLTPFLTPCCLSTEVIYRINNQSLIHLYISYTVFKLVDNIIGIYFTAGVVKLHFFCFMYLKNFLLLFTWNCARSPVQKLKGKELCLFSICSDQVEGNLILLKKQQIHQV